MYFALIFGIFLSQNLYQCISAIINHSLQKKKPKRAFPLEWFRQYYISLINNSNVQNNPLRNLGDSTKIPISIPFFTDSASNTFFYTFILVGSPPQLQTVILDTGSSILGFPCSFCTQCGIHDLPSFKAWSSNSSYYISCTSPQCFQKDCSVTEPTEMCRYYQGYVEGSSIEGFYFSDIISFGMMSQHSPSIRYDYIGCHTQETHLFKTQTANGIVGLSSPTVPEQPYFIEKIIHRIPNSKKIFAMCGADQGGMLQLGGYNASYHLPRGLSSNSNLSGHTTLTLTTPAEDFLDTVGMNNAQDSSIMWTPNLSYRGFSIEIRRIELLLKNISVDIPITKECSLDSGSTYTSFPLHIITALKSFITNSCTNSTEPPCNTQLTFKENGLCWSNLSIEETDKLFPTLLLILPKNETINLQPTSYFSRGENDNELCIQMENRKNDVCILGMSFFKHKNVIFDLEEKKIGFVKASCPSVSIPDDIFSSALTLPEIKDRWDTVFSVELNESFILSNGLLSIIVHSIVYSYFIPFTMTFVWSVVIPFCLFVFLTYIIVKFIKRFLCKASEKVQYQPLSWNSDGMVEELIA